MTFHVRSVAQKTSGHGRSCVVRRSRVRRGGRSVPRVVRSRQRTMDRRRSQARPPAIGLGLEITPQVTFRAGIQDMEVQPDKCGLPTALHAIGFRQQWDWLG